MADNYHTFCLWGEMQYLPKVPFRFQYVFSSQTKHSILLLSLLFRNHAFFSYIINLW